MVAPARAQMTISLLRNVNCALWESGGAAYTNKSLANCNMAALVYNCSCLTLSHWQTACFMLFSALGRSNAIKRKMEPAQFDQSNAKRSQVDKCNNRTFLSSPCVLLLRLPDQSNAKRSKSDNYSSLTTQLEDLKLIRHLLNSCKHSNTQCKLN